MKVVAFNGSPRKDGNTSMLIRNVLGVLEALGIETETVQVGGKQLRGCVACFRCMENKNRHCAVDKDMLNDCIDRMLSADGIILGSPVYFSCMTPEIKALIDRAGMVSRANDMMFRRKVGAAVVAARRAGAVHTFDSINHFFTIGEMIIPGANYWNMGFGREKGEVENDAEGLGIMKTLGENMAWLLKKIAG
ncbi:NADPH-dependent FMN reductase [Desulfosarcina cetonica]|uniref:flavodoxin family protein n=1 Tax=Desulfosarcina cetonica TaxID=90730 RepID=UPI0006D08309|nr:flavodoxin family protein [Desulfosarcina cetonica]VTR69596.1 NADPH-dependent FMN reductase [Desulfosarcina cetonica]